MSDLKPITLYGHASGPNPWKIAILLEELGLKYELKLLEFPELKKEPYESLNPNGRVPTIQDPNTGLTIFESGAIIEYLIDQYDKSQSLHYTTPKEKYATLSWLYFQVSGQGPYFGQKAWFSFFHPEKGIKSAIDRYGNEVKRVTGVIDRHLKKQGTEYLVGNKITFADLAFVPWNWNLVGLLMDAEGNAPDIAKEFPHFNAWNEKVMARASVKKVADDKAKANAQ